MRTFFVLLACAALGASVTTSARDTLSIRVSPNISMAPATVRVLVTVEPNADNRELTLEADSLNFFTSSSVELDGTKAPRTQAFTFKELPAGDYDLAARVIRRNGDATKATASYIVLE